MSVSAPRKTGLKNPAVKFIKWKGARTQGYFYYYDKEIEDEKLRNVRVDLGEGFYVLDKDLFSITGFVESTKSNIISNAVREITDILIIKSYKDKKSEIVLQGPYTELKNTVKDSNIYHYTRDAYIMFRGELCHLSLSGASFASWIKEVESNSAHVNSIVRHTSNEEKMKGIVEYQQPHFEVGDKADKETWELMLKIDSEILQPYLLQYLGAVKTGEAHAPDPESQEQQFDIKNWRQFKMPSGSRMCELTAYQIREYIDRLVEAGDVDGIIYDCLSQATVEYNAALKGWEARKDNGGRPLKDYSLEEIRVMLAKIPADHPAKFFLEAAAECKEEAELDDNVPF